MTSDFWLVTFSDITSAQQALNVDARGKHFVKQFDKNEHR